MVPTAEKIANDVIDVATVFFNKNITALVSGIVGRGDRWNEKACRVNEYLTHLCSQRNIGFIDNSNIDPREHLNNSKLHLNRYGSSILTSNFLDYLNS